MEERAYQFDLTVQPRPIIKVVGVGGGGSNAVNFMYNQGFRDVEFVVCNTDSQALRTSPIPNKIQLGGSFLGGLGAGAIPENGREAANISEEAIREMLSDGTKMVFITAGMGGGTGTGAAPVIAQLARKKGLLTVGIVTAPYKWEGKEKINYALKGIEELKTYCDTVLVVMNDKLAEIHKDLALKDAFSKADDVLAKAVKSVVDVIAKPGDVNTDFMDVKKVLKNAGQAMMSSALGRGEERALMAISDALESPLLNSQEIKGAKRILVTVSTSSKRDLVMGEQDIIVEYLQARISEQADMIKFGISTDEDLQDDLYLTVIAAGFEHENDDLDKFHRGSTEGYKQGTQSSILQVGDKFDFDDYGTGAQVVDLENEVIRFAKLVDLYKNGGPSEKDFAIPSYQRNKVPLYDLRTVPQDRWIELTLYEE
jgi:cell division protein FtsZ